MNGRLCVIGLQIMMTLGMRLNDKQKNQTVKNKNHNESKLRTAKGRLAWFINELTQRKCRLSKS